MEPMFWIPICALILFFYFIYACVNTAQTGAVKRDDIRRTELRNNFDAQLTDRTLEEAVKHNYDKQYFKAQEAVYRFVGEPCITDEKFPICLECEQWAMAVDMCGRGKLPWSMIIWDLNSKTYTRGEREFTDKYLLKLEEELCKAGRKTAIVLERGGYNFTTNKNESQHYLLRDFVRQHGYGCTIRGDRMYWAQFSIYALEYFKHRRFNPFAEHCTDSSWLFLY